MTDSDLKPEPGASSANCITLTDSDDSDDEFEITAMRAFARKSVPGQRRGPRPAWNAARKSAPRQPLNLGQGALQHTAHNGLPPDRGRGARPALPESGTPFSARSSSRDSSAAVEELGNRVKAIEIIRPAQLTFALDISELRLVTSSLPPPSSSTHEFLLTLETTLTITYTDSVPTFRRNTKADSMLDFSQVAFCPRPTSPYWSPANSPYSHLVPARPFVLSLDIPAPSGDARDDTPVIDAVLALSIIDPISKALMFTEKIQLVQELHLSLGETRCIRPIDEQEAYAEVTWRWNVPRSATTMGVTAREMGGKEAGKGKLSLRGMEKILEKALEEEERKAKLMMLSSTEYLSALDSNTLSSLKSSHKRSTFRPRGIPAPSPSLSSSSSELAPATTYDRVRPAPHPLPRTDYVAFMTLGTPYPYADTELPPLAVAPSIKLLQDRSVEKEATEERYLDEMFDDLLFIAEEDKPSTKDSEVTSRWKVGSDGKLKVLQEAEVETFFDSNSFSPSEQLHTIRDFKALATLTSSLSVDPARLKQPELAGHHDALRFERFLAEDNLEVGLELRRAFDIFAKRVGRTAWEVQRAYRALSFDEIISDPCRPPLCAMCGARSCKVHLPDTAADNVPTSTSYAKQSTQHQAVISSPSSNTACRSACAYQKEAPSTSPWTDDDKRRCDEIAKAMPELSPCEMAVIIQKHCAEVRMHFKAREHSPTPLQPLVDPSLATISIVSGKRPKRDAFPLVTSMGYDPCDCHGHCSIRKTKNDTSCLCVSHGIWCDRYCGCSGDCPRRFRGCDCAASGGKCRSDKCRCRLASRECDPELCACPTLNCANSQIRRRNLKRTMIVDSVKRDAGYGLVMLEVATKGDLIGLYGGESFYSNDAFGRLTHSTNVEVGVSYWYNLVLEHAIDSQIYGSPLRFINDLGDHNCECRHTYIDGTVQIAIVASKDLQAGDELSLDYGPEYWKNHHGRGIKT